MGTNFAFIENEHTRRGSRGSIISGKANITPTETTQCATIPTHHLAKLSLSTSPDYVRLFLFLVFYLGQSQFFALCNLNFYRGQFQFNKT